MNKLEMGIGVPKTPEEKNLYNKIDPKIGKDFYYDFAGKETESREPKFIARINEFREERYEILGSGEDRKVQIEKLKNATEKLIKPAISRMKWMIENPESIRQVGPHNNKEIFEAITNILAGTGEIGKYLDEIKTLKTRIQRENPEHEEIPELNI